MFSLSAKTKRASAVLIIFFIVLSIGLTPPTKKAEAVGVPVIDAIGNALIAAGNAIFGAIQALSEQTIGGTSPIYTGAAWAGRQAMKLILHRLTESIVAWIDSGFNGNPGFITNPEAFFKDTADIVIGDFLINNKALDFLCDPFKINVRLAIGLQYQPFTENIRCRLTGAIKNVQGAYEDFVGGNFINGGGWDSWLQVTTVPQNNQMGALILAQTELDANISGSKEAELAKGNWSGGFLSWEKCTNFITGETTHGSLGSTQIPASDGWARATPGVRATEDEFGAPIPTGEEETASFRNALKGPSNTTCEIQTPGKEIVDQLGWAKSSSIRELEISNDLDAIFNALANMVIKYGMDYFSSVVSGDNMNQSNPADTYNAYLDSLQQAQQRGRNNNSNGGNQGGGNQGGGNQNGVDYNEDGSVDFNQDFVDTSAATEAISSQMSLEQQYIAAQGNIFNLLEATRSVFASSTCSDSVKDTVERQITGNFTGTKLLPWNESDAVRAIASSTENMTALDNANTALESATNDAAVSRIVAPLADLNLASASSVATFSVDGTFFGQIKNWVVSKVNTYGSSCNLDTSALSEWGIQ